MRTSDHKFRALVVLMAVTAFVLCVVPDANWPYRTLPPSEALWRTMTVVIVLGGFFLVLLSRDPQFSFLSGVISVACIIATMMLAVATQVFPGYNAVFVVLALLVVWISSVAAAMAAEGIDSYFWRGAWETLLPVAVFTATVAAQQERWLLAGASIVFFMGFQFFWSPWKKEVEYTAH